MDCKYNNLCETLSLPGAIIPVNREMFFIRLLYRSLFEISSHSLKKAPVVFIGVRSE